MIKEFVKRQDRVCALQWDGTEERLKQMLTLVRCVPQVNFKKSRPPMRMPQPNGTFQYVQVGQWVVRDDTGGLSILPDALFRMRYRDAEDEAVEQADTATEGTGEQADAPPEPEPEPTDDADDADDAPNVIQPRRRGRPAKGGN